MGPTLSSAHRLRAGLATAALAGTVAGAAPGGASTGLGAARAAPRSAPSWSLTVQLDHPAASFRPDQALGADVDGLGQGDTADVYTRANLRAMRSAGLRSLSYRLRTELGVEAWHFNPRGRFSDARRRRGYWTSSDAGGGFAHTNGYRLPRRGDTIDQAADAGFSRLDDGRRKTFWKSNPYLDPHFTHEPEGAHPQWVLIDFGTHRRIDAVRIDWGAPRPRRIEVQYWVGPSAIIQNGHPLGHWHDFPRSRFAVRASSQTVRLAAAPRSVRFVRVVLSRSDHAAPRGSGDLRDRLGFAVRELGAGSLRGGRLRDLVRHTPDQRQTVTMASSTDPWHTAGGVDPGTEQPSFGRVVSSGLTSGLPILVPVPVLYGTPADAVAEIRYLLRRHIPLRGVELGEEPDGQLVSPEDYGALFLRFGRAIHRVAPGLALGGPGYQTSIPDWLAWPDRAGRRSWTGRLVAYLRSHRRLGELSFFSFEWYPFDDPCLPSGPLLQRSASTLHAVLSRQYADGLPRGLPVYVTEYGYSAFAGQPEADRAGALLNADVVGQLLTDGASAAFVYGYEPDTLMTELPRCHSWGNLALLQSTADRRILGPLATYYAARLLTQTWTQPGDAVHQVYPVAVTPPPGTPPGRLGAYAVRRPDGRLALLLLNKDPAAAARVTIAVQHGRTTAPLTGPLDAYLFGPGQYVWHARGAHGYPAPDRPPAHFTADAARLDPLPPYSISVLRGPA